MGKDLAKPTVAAGKTPYVRFQSDNISEWDEVVIPPEQAGAYQPRPLPIARVYQANDGRRTIGRPVSRAEVDLPEGRFVLCCFSRHYKITEEMFGAWMSILRQADGTVMWLAKDNVYSQANMLVAANRAGIPENRLIFPERGDPNLYLSRLSLADLYLDTFPYDAGTIASDAIRMRLPLVTMCGQAFASRMAASLLQAVGASQGITTTLSRCVETAALLASNSVEYARYKAQFTELAWNTTIGDITGFTREYEETWCRIVREMRYV
jgi:predicted O-linked N-acetylglucosamine transferase (SPINDLY family)